MLGKLLLIREKLRLECPVLLLRPAARTGSRKREGVAHAVLKLDERLGRSARDLDVGTREVEHIRRRVDRAQHAIDVEQTALKRSAQAVGEDDLKDVTLKNMMLGGLDHLAVARPVKERRDLTEKPAALLLAFLARF